MPAGKIKQASSSPSAGGWGGSACCVEQTAGPGWEMEFGLWEVTAIRQEMMAAQAKVAARGGPLLDTQALFFRKKGSIV